jgi:gliding motility-associated-like protein
MTRITPPVLIVLLCFCFFHTDGQILINGQSNIVKDSSFTMQGRVNAYKNSLRTDPEPANRTMSILPDCTPGTFYGINEEQPNQIHSFTLSGNSVVYNGIITSGPVNISTQNLAIAKLDSLHRFVVVTNSVTAKFTTKWDTIASAFGSNIGGQGNYLYGMNFGSIVRLQGLSVTVVTGFNAAVADISVDTTGNLYVVSSSNSTAAQPHHLKIISPNGVTLAQYPVSNSTAYGSFLIDSTLYLGMREGHPFPNSLLPLKLVNNAVIMGTPIPMPSWFKGVDLASCGTVCTDRPVKPAVNVTQPDCTTATGTITISPSALPSNFSINHIDYSNTTGMFSGLAAGTYQVTARYNNGCTSQANVVTINSQPTTLPALTIQPTQPSCDNPSGTITINSPSGVGVSYSIDGLNYSNSSGIFSGLSPATYTVTAKGNGGCLSPPAIVNITPVPQCDIFVPNTFTPNNDGKNDNFLVYGNDIARIEMVIWNQWGEKIHTTKDRIKGWDGTSRGRAQPQGVYIYTIKVKLLNGTEKYLKGVINLLR